ncbi:MAG TPA: PPC domain-containing DNA-binding protein [Candidatus Saccharimonadales bacterium]|nr:PPC domain-containing DNA-binding protein [Candidatus Saccharimonadales bacterium]
MKVIFHDNTTLILRFDRDEEILESLSQFCAEENIHAAYFSTIGAVKEVILAYYNLETQTYQDRVITEDLEITSVTGNVGVLKGKIIIHAHGTFGKSNFEIIGGHIKKMLISATGEVVLKKLKGNLERAFDKETGLNLMK